MPEASGARGQVVGSSDENLLDRACEGDGEALGRLLEQHAAALREHVAGRIPRRWQALLSADDVVQQTFTDAFLNVRQVVSRSESAFVAWLHRIAKHNVGSALRGLEAEKRGGDRQKIEFRTRDDSLAELCALAAIPQSTPSREAAKREVELSVRLQPPGIIRILESGLAVEGQRITRWVTWAPFRWTGG